MLVITGEIDHVEDTCALLSSLLVRALKAELENRVATRRLWKGLRFKV